MKLLTLLLAIAMNPLLASDKMVPKRPKSPAKIRPHNNKNGRGGDPPQARQARRPQEGSCRRPFTAQKQRQWRKHEGEQGWRDDGLASSAGHCSRSAFNCSFWLSQLVAKLNPQRITELPALISSV